MAFNFIKRYDIAMICVIIILGAGLSVGLTYAIFQPQLNNLQIQNTQLTNTLISISNEINTIENRDFHVLWSYVIPREGENYNWNSSTTWINGKSIRILWAMSSEIATGWIRVIIYCSNGDYFTERYLSCKSGADSWDVAITPGMYFFNLQTSFAVNDFWVTVLDYY